MQKGQNLWQETKADKQVYFLDSFLLPIEFGMFYLIPNIWSVYVSNDQKINILNATNPKV